MKHIDELREKHRGERLTYEEWNAILRAARERDALTAAKDKTTLDWVQVYAADNVPAYSLFGVVPGAEEDTPPRANVEKIGLESSGSPLVLLTNDSVPLAAGTWGWARPIGYFRPCKLQVTGDTPTVGFPVGPDPDQYGITAAPSSYGMVCVGVAEAGYAVVMRTREFVGVVGEVTEVVTPYDPVEKKLGSGKIKIQYADHADEDRIDDALSPLDAEWEVDVFNICAVAILVGELVRAVSALGIGLVVTPCGAGEGEEGSSGGGSESESGSEGETIDVVVCDPYYDEDCTIIFPQKRITLPPGSYVEDLTPTTVTLIDCGDGSTGSFGASLDAIEFTLTETLDTTDASAGATVDAYYGDTDPGASVTVYNKALASNYMFEGASGAKGMALKNSNTGHYVIWMLQCPTS